MLDERSAQALPPFTLIFADAGIMLAAVCKQEIFLPLNPACPRGTPRARHDADHDQR
jgi:hypothetical protein